MAKESDMSQQVAAALVSIGAIRFERVIFKSGIESPMYIDNRTLPSHLEEWTVVLNAFVETLNKQSVRYEVFAGIETGAIPHSAVLGYRLYTPTVYVRKAVKDHGLKKIIEGGDVGGKYVLLIEDHVSTGESSLRGVEPLRQLGGEVDQCIAISSYNFLETFNAFDQQQVILTTLTSAQTILNVALQMGKITTETQNSVSEWLEDPKGWGLRHPLKITE